MNDTFSRAQDSIDSEDLVNELPNLYEVRGVQGPELESPSETQMEYSSKIEKLSVLKSIYQKVLNPSWVVSLEDIVGLLLDLSGILEASQLSQNLGETVAEIPWQSDSLGNVYMKHQKVKVDDVNTLSFLAKGLKHLTHFVYQKGRKVRVDNELWEDLADFLRQYPVDDMDTEGDILATKRKIRKIREESNRIDRRNGALACELHKAKLKIHNLEDDLFDFYHERTMAGKLLRRADAIVAHGSCRKPRFLSKLRRSNDISCVVDSGESDIQPRKLVSTKRLEQQMDSILNFDDIEEENSIDEKRE